MCRVHNIAQLSEINHFGGEMIRYTIYRFHTFWQTGNRIVTFLLVMRYTGYRYAALGLSDFTVMTNWKSFPYQVNWIFMSIPTRQSIIEKRSNIGTFLIRLFFFLLRRNK